MFEKLNDIKIYISENIKTFLAKDEEPLLNIIVGNYDTEHIKYETVLFINPDQIIFNGTENIYDYDKTLTVEFSFICRKDDPTILAKRIENYMNALIDLFIFDLNLSGIATMNITAQNYYDGIDGDANIKGMALTTTLTY